MGVKHAFGEQRMFSLQRISVFCNLNRGFCDLNCSSDVFYCSDWIWVYYGTGCRGGWPDHRFWSCHDSYYCVYVKPLVVLVLLLVEKGTGVVLFLYTYFISCTYFQPLSIPCTGGVF